MCNRAYNFPGFVCVILQECRAIVEANRGFYLGICAALVQLDCAGYKNVVYLCEAARTHLRSLQLTVAQMHQGSTPDCVQIADGTVAEVLKAVKDLCKVLMVLTRQVCRQVLPMELHQ